MYSASIILLHCLLIQALNVPVPLVITQEVEELMAIANLTPEIPNSKPLRYQTLERMAENFGLDRHLKQQIFGISPRERARLQKDNGILNPLVVERLNRFNRITQQAIGLFEDRQGAMKWLQTPKYSLAGIAKVKSVRT